VVDAEGNQLAGQLDKKHRPVTDVLRETRSGIDLTDNSNGAFFGQNVLHVNVPGIQVHKGDEVIVTKLSANRNIKLT
jgi:hypothetical protein